MRRFFHVVMLLVASVVPQGAWALALSVNIDGLSPALRDHVAAYVDILQQQESGADNLTLARLQRLHDRAPQQIKTALQVYGYYQASVQSSLQQEEGTWVATYTVNVGEPIRITEVNLKVEGEGRTNPAIAERIKQFSLHKGDVFVHPQYEKARDGLLRTAIEQGFLDANFTTREVRVDLRSDSVSVDLQMQTGARYYFGPVSFRQDMMKETFLRQYLKFRPGDPYNPATLLRLQSTLNDSGLYQSVDVRSRKLQAVDHRVPIDVTITARKRREWRFGLGYATDTGARGSISHSRIVGDEGDKFESKLLLSEKRNSLTAGYTIPLADPTTDQAGLGVRYVDETTESRESKITGLTASNTSAWGEWQRIFSLNYEREVYLIADEPQQTRRVLYPELSISRVRADNRIYTRHGSRVYFEVRGANRNLLSDTNYGQLRLGLKWIRGIGRDNRIILRGDFGSTNVAELDRLPASQRFFAGGDNSVRGYSYEELGPKNAAGEVVGGKHLIVGSVELEHRLAGKWSVAAFYDRGNAINSMSDPLVAGAGVGLRWNSPVGPLRLDFAWALNKQTDRFRLHVVIGPDL